MKPISSLMVFRNGTIAALDEHGNQIPDLQRKTLQDILRSELERMEYSVDGCRILVSGGEYVAEREPKP